MKIIAMRHGQTEWNLAGKLQGWRDSAITPKARRQLQRTPLISIENPVVFASDLGRALSSARIVADRLGCQVIADARLRERSFGALDGKQVNCRSVPDSYWHDYHRRYQIKISRIPNVESEQALERRIKSWLKEVASAYSRHTIVVVSHGEWIRALNNIVDNRPSWHQGHGVAANGQPLMMTVGMNMFEDAPC